MTEQTTKIQTETFDIEVFFDGGCPLCLREVKLLKRWDRKHRIRFIDIDAETFQSAAFDKTYEDLMAQMHGRLPDGTWVRGVEVFRRMYAAVGLGPFVWMSRCPGISHLLDLGYQVFARHRLQLTGRCSGSCTVKSAP